MKSIIAICIAFAGAIALGSLPSGKGKIPQVLPPNGLVDLISNGDFSTKNNWVLNPGWAITNALAQFTGSDWSSLAQTTATLSSGSTYRLSLTLDKASAAGSVFLSSSSFTGSSKNLGDDGAIEVDLICSDPSKRLVLSPGVGWQGSVDNISLFEVSP